MWVTRSEREWSRRHEAMALAAEARRAEIRFCAATKALASLLADSRVTDMLNRHGIRRIALGRSSRLPESGNAEGLAVLEGVVLAGIVAKILSDGELTRWLSCHHPKELAALHSICAVDGKSSPLRNWTVTSGDVRAVNKSAMRKAEVGEGD
jgi:hypothetical protein